MNTYEEHKNKHGLSMAIALVILYFVNKLRNRLFLKNKILKGYANSTNPDVVIFESAAFIHSAVAYSFSGSDLDLDDEDGQLLEAIYDSIAIISGLIEKHTTFPNVPETFTRRGYYPDTQKSVRTFIRILIASKGRKDPLPKYTFKLEDPITEAGIQAFVLVFSSTMLPAAVQVITGIIKHHTKLNNP